ncbi:hypothetical protein CspHIS471_0303610 [Cutaneotrichosporon sp. HIS471]|nr:hypothetical protein CspHIS471_0303610 [Cutaneotrichosporon sp. HIS471]
MSPQPPTTSTFFSGGSPKAPRFGASPSSKRRPFTPGSTRDDLAQKRAAEAARQQASLTNSPPSRSLGASSALGLTEEEPRTSFSDDMGRALNSIGMVAEPPPPSIPVASPKETEASNDLPTAEAEADGIPRPVAALPTPKETETVAPQNERLAPPNRPGAVRQVSNPVKDVKTAEFDGVPVFFLDSAMESGMLGHSVVSIPASPKKRSLSLANTPGPSQRASAVPGGPLTDTPEASQCSSEMPDSQAASQPPAQPARNQFTSAPDATSQPEHETFGTEGYTPQELSSPLGLEEHPLHQPEDGTWHDSERLADREQRRTFGQPSDDAAWASSDMARAVSPGVGGTPEIASKRVADASTGVADKALYAAGAVGVGAVGAMGAAALSGKEDEPVMPAVSRDAPAHSDKQDGHTPAEGAEEDTQTLTLTFPPSQMTQISQDPGAPAAAINPVQPAGQDDTPTIPDADALTTAKTNSPIAPAAVAGAAVGTAAGVAAGTAAASASAFPDTTRTPDRPGRQRAMSSVSAVPDDLDQDCLPDLNEEMDGMEPTSPQPRDLAASPAAVPDGYDSARPAQHTSSLASIPVYSGTQPKENAVYSPSGPPGLDTVPAPVVYSPGAAKSLESSPIVYSPGTIPAADTSLGDTSKSEPHAPTDRGLVTAPVVYSPGTDSPREKELATPAWNEQAFSPSAAEAEELQPAFSEDSEGANHLGMAGMAGVAGVVGAGALAGAAALGAPSQMPEERSMSAASVVAIKDGRTGVPGAVRTLNLVCEPAPKTGETFMTNLSATPSENSLGGETRRGNEAALSTASIIAIKGGNEGAPPSPPGRSPLAASRTANEVLDEAERKHPTPLSGTAAGAAAGAVGAGLVLASNARDTTQERGDRADDLRGHTSTSEIRSATPRDEGDFHTAATSTPAAESFVTGTEGTSTAGETTPIAPGDYLSAGRAATPHAPGAFPVDPPEPVRIVATPPVGPPESVEEPDKEAETLLDKPEQDATATAEAPDSASKAPASADLSPASGTSATAAAGAAAGVLAAGAGAAASKAGSSTTSTIQTSRAQKPVRTISIERKPVPKVTAEISGGPSRPAPRPKPSAGHSRTGSKSSAGSGRKVGFMTKLKGEFKVLSGKLKKDEKMVAEGERMKHGQL